MFKPMLAATVEDLYQLSYPLYASPKIDGIRCLVMQGVAYSRTLKRIPNKFVQEVLSNIKLDYPLDGELIVVGGDFNATQSAIMSEEGEPNFRYVVFDVATDEVFFQRLPKIADMGAATDNRVKLLPHKIVNSVTEALEYYDFAMKAGFEGMMLRAFDGPYKYGRSTLKESYLLKYKEFRDAEATIIGFSPKLQNKNVAEEDELGYTKRSSKKAGLVELDTLGSLEVSDGEKKFSVGSGFDDEQRKEIWMNKDKYMGRVITYTYQELSHKGNPRFPVFKGFRQD